MGLERFYTDDGRPAFVLATRPGNKASEATGGITYPRAPDFKRLWDKAEGGQQAKVDNQVEPG